MKYDPHAAHPPQRLLHYDPKDWPNPDCHPECAFWAAWDEWDEVHPFDLDWAGDPDALIARGPDVPWHPEWTI